ncbi:MAG: flagellar protein FlgN [Negativicutes bacterium]|nr:flagellar protein FlgN [Negativicutes bacterium]
MSGGGFIEILDKLVAVYSKLLDTAKSKREALVAADLPAVDAANKQEEKLVWQGGRLDGERVMWLRRFSSENKLPAAEPTVAQVAALYDPGTAEQICVKARQLREVLDQLDLVNRQNANLLFKALRMIEFNINVLTTATTGGGQVYGSKNSRGMTEPVKQGVLDARG